MRRVPGELSVPTERNSSTEWVKSQGRFDRVSTLLTIVGAMYRPLAAGKNGGFRRGMPRLPSSDSMRAVSSPTMYAPAPQCRTMSTLKSVPRMFLPTSPAA